MANWPLEHGNRGDWAPKLKAYIDETDGANTEAVADLQVRTGTVLNPDGTFVDSEVVDALVRETGDGSPEPGMALRYTDNGLELVPQADVTASDWAGAQEGLAKVEPSTTGTNGQELIVKGGAPTYQSPYVFNLSRYLNIDRTGVGSSKLGIKAAVADAEVAYQYTGYGGVVELPPGTYKVDDLEHGGGVLFRGASVGRTRIVHEDGAAEPLIHVTGADTGISAHPYGGFEHVSLWAGDDTTALIYYDGRIDNHVVFHALQMIGHASNQDCDGISMKDWLNAHFSIIRWDKIGGWGINVRDVDAFGGSTLSIRDFSYDNQEGAAGGAAFGQGMLRINCGSFSTDKARVKLDVGRIELNDALQSSVVRIVQNSTVLSNGGPQVQVHWDDIEVRAHSSAKNVRLLSTDQRDVSYRFDNTTIYGIAEIYNNDGNNSKNRIPGSQVNVMLLDGVKSDDTPFNATGIGFVSSFMGIPQGIASGTTSLASTAATGRGGIIYAQQVNTAPRTFAWRNIENDVGRYVGTAGSLGTGSITSGTAALTMSATTASQCVPGSVITVAGAGTAGGELTAVINAVNYTTNVVTLDRNASTTVSGAAVATKAARYVSVPMEFRGTAAPTTLAHLQGDYCRNTAPTETGTTPNKYVVMGWICVASGTPGTWVEDRRLTGN